MSRQGTLASRAGTWHGPSMAGSPPNAAGGALVALGALAGAAIGFAVGEVTPGFLIGLGLGIAAALLVWWRTHR